MSKNNKHSKLVSAFFSWLTVVSLLSSNFFPAISIFLPVAAQTGEIISLENQIEENLDPVNPEINEEEQTAETQVEIPEIPTPTDPQETPEENEQSTDTGILVDYTPIVVIPTIEPEPTTSPELDTTPEPTSEVTLEPTPESIFELPTLEEPQTETPTLIPTTEPVEELAPIEPLETFTSFEETERSLNEILGIDEYAGQEVVNVPNTGNLFEITPQAVVDTTATSGSYMRNIAEDSMASGGGNSFDSEYFTIFEVATNSSDVPYVAFRGSQAPSGVDEEDIFLWNGGTNEITNITETATYVGGGSFVGNLRDFNGKISITSTDVVKLIWRHVYGAGASTSPYFWSSDDNEMFDIAYLTVANGGVSPDSSDPNSDFGHLAIDDSNNTYALMAMDATDASRRAYVYNETANQLRDLTAETMASGGGNAPLGGGVATSTNSRLFLKNYGSGVKAGFTSDTSAGDRVFLWDSADNELVNVFEQTNHSFSPSRTAIETTGHSGYFQMVIGSTGSAYIYQVTEDTNGDEAAYYYNEATNQVYNISEAPMATGGGNAFDNDVTNLGSISTDSPIAVDGSGNVHALFTAEQGSDTDLYYYSSITEELTNLSEITPTVGTISNNNVANHQVFVTNSGIPKVVWSEDYPGTSSVDTIYAWDGATGEVRQIAADPTVGDAPDITGTIVQERALMDSNGKLKIFYDVLNYGYYVWDEDLQQNIEITNFTMQSGTAPDIGSPTSFGAGSRFYSFDIMDFDSKDNMYLAFEEGNSSGDSDLYLAFIDTVNQGPGSVTNGLDVWLRADEEVYNNSSIKASISDGEVVEAWDDVSGSDNHFDETNSGDPTWIENSINFNPALDFDGDDYVAWDDGNTLWWEGDDNLHVYSVIQADQTGVDMGWIDTNNSGDSGNNFVAARYDSAGASSGQTNTIEFFVGDDIEFDGSNLQTTRPQFVDFEYRDAGGSNIIFSADVNGNSYSTVDDGSPPSVGAGVTTNTNAFLLGNAPVSGDSNWDGRIAEMFTYSELLNTNETNHIESYLSLKYGITKGTGTTNTSLTFDEGNITAWNSTISESVQYQNNVFGIGTDVHSGLDQKVSKSEDDNNGIIIATDQDFTSSNIASNRTSLGDGNFFIMGDDGDTLDFTDDFDGSVNRAIGRSWKGYATGTVGTTYFAFPNNLLTIPQTPETVNLVQSTDETYDGTDTVIPLTDDGTHYYASFTPSNGEYFTIYYVPQPNLNYYGEGLGSTQVSSVTIPNGGTLDAITFSTDGTRMYGTDETGVNLLVNQYDLSTAFDVSTASFVSSLDVSAQVGASAETIQISNDGSKIFVGRGSNIYAYDLGSNYQISSAAYNNEEFTPSSIGSSVSGMNAMQFSSDGTALIVATSGSAPYRIAKFNLSTAYDLNTISSGGFLDFDLLYPTFSFIPLSMGMNSTGTELYLHNNSTSFAVFTMSTPYDIYTLDLENVFTTTGLIDGNITYVESEDVYLGVDNLGTEAIKIDIVDDVFVENSLNDGSIDGQLTIVIAEDTFADVDADDVLDIGTELTVGNLPTGLTPSVVLSNSDTVATMTLTGNASSHQNFDDFSGITFEFTDAAFTTSTAANVVNATGPHSTNYGIDFETNINEIVYTYPDAFENYTYDSISRDLTSEDSSPQEILFNSDGTKMLLLGNSGNDITEYTLTTAYDTSSGSSGNVQSISSYQGTPQGFHFSADGVQMFLTGADGNIDQFDLTTPFDVTTIAINQTVNPPGTIGNNVRDVFLSPDGNTMILVENASNNEIFEYSLSSSFDVSTATETNVFNVGVDDTAPEGVAFSPNGMTMFVSGDQGNEVIPYTLTAPYDLSSPTIGTPISLPTGNTDPRGITFDRTGSQLLVVDSDDNVYRFAITNSTAFTENVLNDGSVDGSIKAYVSGGDTFKDTDADDVLDYTSEVTITNLPTGLTGDFALSEGDRLATITFSGNATFNQSGNTVTDLLFDFNLTEAFVTNPAVAISGASGGASSGLGITFTGNPVVPPGGISTNLQLHLKSGTGVNLTGSDVDSWEDLSTSGLLFEPLNANSANRPELATNVSSLNFNDGILFDGVQEGLEDTFVTTLTDPTIYWVSQHLDNASESYIFDETTTADTSIKAYYDATNTRFVAKSTAGSGNEIPFVPSISYPYLYTTFFDSTAPYLNINGQLRGETAGTGFDLESLQLGAKGDESSFFNGYIPEIAIYEGNVAAADEQKIESYFAIKYGKNIIAVDDDASIVEGNYVLSDDTVIWDTGLTASGEAAWTATTTPQSYGWESVAYGDGSFVASSNNTSTDSLMYSTDGTSWTSSTAPSGRYDHVTFGNSTFVAAGGSSEIVYSTDNGVNWLAATDNTFSNHDTVGFGNGTFVSLGGNVTSTDGITWTAMASGPSTGNGDWTDIAYGNSTFVAVKDAGINDVAYSTDNGNNWTEIDISSKQIRTVTFGNGIFVALADHPSSTGDAQEVYYSSDGITWNSSTPVDDNQWSGITFGNGIFVAVADNNSTTFNVTMYSYDGIDWFPVSTPVNADWTAVAYGEADNKFVAVASSGTNRAIYADADSFTLYKYQNNVAAIAQDDGSDLLQNKSKSQEPNSLVTIGVSATDGDATADDILEDKEGFAWGNDNGSISDPEQSDIPSSVFSRLERVWFAQETGEVGNLEITFDLAGQTAIDSAFTLDKYILLVDNDGTFADATEVESTSLVGTDVTFDYNLEPGTAAYFTLGLTTGQAPGGVAGGLEFWIKADTETYQDSGGTTPTTDGSAFLAWHDQSLFQADFDDDFGGSPTWTESAINFNPALELDGSSSLKYDNGSTIWTEGDSQLSLYSMVEADAGMIGVNAGYIDTQDSGDSSDNMIGIEYLASGSNSNTNTIQYFIGDDIEFDGSNLQTTLPNFIAFDYDSSGATNGFLNGIKYGTIDDGSGPTGTITTNTNSFILGNDPRNNTADWDGRISEIFTYDRLLTEAEKQRVDSYLAIKYGLTLSNDSDADATTSETIGSESFAEGDYVVNAGAAVIWDESANNGYHNHVAVIGQDSAQGLDQKISSSESETDLGLIISTDQDFTSSNVTGTRTSLSDSSFLAVGNNNYPVNFYDNYTGQEQRHNFQKMGREWKVQETGSVGSVYVAIPNTAPFPATASNQLLIVSNSSGLLQTNSTEYSMTDDGTHLYAQVDFADGDYFSFAGVPAAKVEYAPSAATSSSSSLFDTGLDGIANGFFMTQDGTKAYVVKNNSGVGSIRDILEFTFSTAYDISTATLNHTLDVSAEFPSAEMEGITISSDGSKMYVGDDADGIFEYDLSTANTLSSASFSGNSADITGLGQIVSGGLEGFAISSDGTKFFVAASNTTKEIGEYSLSTPYDISTISFTQGFESYGSSTADSMTFDSTGTEMYYLIGSSVEKYILSSAYDISTASYQDTITLGTFNPDHGIFVHPDGNQFITHGVSDIFYTSYLNDDEGINEVSGNDGSVTGDMLVYIYNEDFADIDADNILDYGTEFTIDNLPPGLTASAVLEADDTVARISFSGNAAAHQNPDDLDSIQITFLNAAFVGGSAAAVTNSTGHSTGVDIDFDTNVEAIVYAGVGAYDLATSGSSSSFQDMTAEDSAPHEIVFNEDGTKMFMVGNNGNDVTEYDLTVPYDITTESPTGDVFSVNTQTSSPVGIHFSPDGTSMYIVGETVDSVHQYSLETGFDINSTGGVSHVVSQALPDISGVLRDVFLTPDGTKLLVIDEASSDFVRQYTLSTPYDVTTIGTGTSFTISGETEPYGIAFTPNGDRMFLSGNQGDDVNEYILSTNYDVTTAAITGNILDNTSGNTDFRGITIKPGGEQIFIVDTDDNIYIYDMDVTPFVENVLNDGTLDGTMTAYMVGGTFADADADDLLDDTTEVSISNLPVGITPTYTLASSDTKALITLGGNATPNNSGNDLTDLQFVFEDIAFTIGDASLVGNSTGPASSNVGITYDDNPAVPGGVSTGLEFWISADSEVYTSGSVLVSADGEEVFAWDDLSGNGNDLDDTQSGDPLWRENSINFNPAIEFDGSSWIGWDASNVPWFDSDSAISYHIFMKPDFANADMGVIDTDANAGDLNDLALRLVATGGNSGRTNTFEFGINDDLELDADNIATTNNTSLMFSYDSGTSQFLSSVNGQRYTVLPDSNGHPGGTISTGADRYLLGNDPDSDGVHYDGLITENMTYNRVLADSEYQRIESYFAIKYGQEVSADFDGDGNLGETDAGINEGDIVALNGLQTVWDYSENTDYQTEIMIIGQDSTQAIDQKVAKSQIDGAFDMVIANDIDFVAPNSAIGRTSLADGEFVVVASDTGTVLMGSSFEGRAGQRINRTWKVTEVGTPGAVNVGVPSVMPRIPGDLYMVVSSDTTFDLTDTLLQTSYDATSDRLYVNHDFSNGDYFTFVVPYLDDLQVNFEGAFTISGAGEKARLNTDSYNSLASTLDDWKIVNDGDKMIIGWGLLEENDFSIPYDFRSVSTGDTQIVSGFAGSVYEDLATNHDGTRALGRDQANNTTIYQGEFNGQFDVTTFTAGTSILDVSGDTSRVAAITYSHDGTKVYIYTQEGLVIEYTLGDPHDISTAVKTETLDLSSIMKVPTQTSSVDMVFGNNGKYLYLNAIDTGDNNPELMLFEATIPYDLSTYSFVEKIAEDVNGSDAEGIYDGVDINPNGHEMYLSSNGKLYKLNLEDEGFKETEANDGAVSGTLRLTLPGGQTFQDTDADDVLDVGTEITVSNIPAGLTPVVTLSDGDTVASLSFTGNATSHEDTDDLTENSPLGIVLNSSAFTIGDNRFIKNAASRTRTVTMNFNDNFANLYYFYEGALDVSSLQHVNTEPYGEFVSAGGSDIQVNFESWVNDFSGGPDYMAHIPNGNGLIYTGSTQADRLYITDAFDGTTFSTVAFSNSDGYLPHFEIDIEDIFLTPYRNSVYFASDISPGSNNRFLFELPLRDSYDVSGGNISDYTSSEYIYDANKIHVGINFSSFEISFDGTKLMTSNNTEEFNIFDLTTPFDITTATNLTTVTADSNLGNIGKFTISYDGKSMLYNGDNNEYKYAKLTNPYDPSEAQVVSSISLAELSSVGLSRYFLNETRDRFFVNDIVFDGSTPNLVSGPDIFEMEEYTIGTGALQESIKNDGSIDGEIQIRLVGDKFADADNDDILDYNDEYTISLSNGTLTGLNYEMTLSEDDTVATFTTTGSAFSVGAYNHQDADDIDSLTFDFKDAAFVASSAANVTNAASYNPGIGINFNDNTYALNYQFGNYEFDNMAATGKSLNVNGTESNSHDIEFNNDGTKMYMAGHTNDTVYEYTLTTAYDLDTASLNGNTLTLNHSLPYAIEFNNDGTKFFSLDGTFGSGNIQEYSLSTAYDLSTATFAGVGEQLYLENQEQTARGFAFSNDGKRLFVIGTTDQSIVEYHLNTAFDVNTAVYAGAAEEFFATGSTNPTDMVFDSTGYKLYVTNSSGQIRKYILESEFDVSTASDTGETFNASAEGFAFSADGSKLFSLNSSDVITEYDANLTTAYPEAVANDGSIDNTTVIEIFFTGGEGFSDLDEDNILDEALSGGNELTIGNVPAGLTPVVTLSQNDRLATVTFTGNATNHEDINDVTDLTFDFTNFAFQNSFETSTSTVANATGYSSNIGIDFQDAPASVSGIVYQDLGTTPAIAGIPVRAILNGVTDLGSTTTASDGTYSIALSQNPTPGDILAVYINNNAQTGDYDALGLLSYNTPTATIDLWDETITFESEDGSSMDQADLTTAASFDPTDMELFTAPGTEYDFDDDISLRIGENTAVDFDDDIRLTESSNTDVRLLIQSGGSLNVGDSANEDVNSTGTVDFILEENASYQNAASTTTQTIRGNISIGTGATLDVNGSFLLTSGDITFADATASLQVDTYLQTNGDGTITSNGHVFETGLLINSSITLADDLDMNTRFIETSGNGVLDLAGNNLAGSGLYNNNGTTRLFGTETIAQTLDTDSGTMEFYGNNAGSTTDLNSYGNTFYNLQINDTNATENTFETTASLTINGDFTLTDGIFDANDDTINILGDISKAVAATFTADTSTFNLNGSADQNILGTWIFENFTIADTGARTIGFEEDITQTIGGAFVSDLSLGNVVNIRTVDNTGTVLSDDSQHTINLDLIGGASIGSIDFVDVADSILQEDGVVKTPQLNPSDSTDSGNSSGWFPDFLLDLTVFLEGYDKASNNDFVEVDIEFRTGSSAADANTLKYSVQDVALNSSGKPEAGDLSIPLSTGDYYVLVSPGTTQNRINHFPVMTGTGITFVSGVNSVNFTDGSVSEYVSSGSGNATSTSGEAARAGNISRDGNKQINSADLLAGSSVFGCTSSACGVSWEGRFDLNGDDAHISSDLLLISSNFGLSMDVPTGYSE